MVIFVFDVTFNIDVGNKNGAPVPIRGFVPLSGASHSI